MRDDSDYEMYKVFISNSLEFNIGSSGTIYERLTGMKRKIHSVAEPKTAQSYIFYEESNEKNYTVYMGDVE